MRSRNYFGHEIFKKGNRKRLQNMQLDNKINEAKFKKKKTGLLELSG